MANSKVDVVVIGAGLAGSECAWQLAQNGHSVLLVEQRPLETSAAHVTDKFGELVCSNSFKSLDPLSAPGLLKHELQALGSLILEVALKNQIPAGQALAVDREKFSSEVTKRIKNHPKITVANFSLHRVSDVDSLPGVTPQTPVVFATGPLTHPQLAEDLTKLTGNKLYFYDAIAPIVAGDSINKSIAFLQNRNDKSAPGQDSDEGDYLNCPLNKQQYEAFINALACAEKVELQEFEKALYFQGCQPIEALLERGPMTLAFGPMKPVGLQDTRTNEKPFAVVQLRKEDSEGRAWNMVGFQTKLKYPEQKRVFSLIPGLENAEFYRFGSLHRNTYIHSPVLLTDQFSLKSNPRFYFAGQITGVEGYLESTAIGALVGKIIGFHLLNQVGETPSLQLPLPPPTTAIGALAEAIIRGRIKNFQPMNINWGLVPLSGIDERDKQKKEKLVARAKRQLNHWMALLPPGPLGNSTDLQIEANTHV